MRQAKQSADVAAANILSVLANRSYRYLFISQICSLLASSMAVIGLYLTAFAVSGWDAGAAIGLALAVKMAAANLANQRGLGLTAGSGKYGNGRGQWQISN